MATGLIQSLPTQALPKGIDLKPKAARAWIESLPLTRTAEAARTLVEHLGILNRGKIGADERFEAMEAYRPMLETLLEELEHIFVYSTLPLPPKQAEAAELARALATECGLAYRIFIQETSSKLLAFGGKKQIPLATFRALSCSARVLLQAFKTYYPAPPGAWMDLHMIFAYAEESKLLAETPDVESKMSLLDVYCEPLLLSLSDPYRLMYREADKVLEILAQNRNLVTLTAERPENLDPTKVFLVALDSDRAPRLMVIAIKEPPGQVLRLLELGRLVDKMRQRQQALANNREAQAKSKAAHDTADLMGRLLKLWGDPPKRQFRRNPSDTGVALCSGIKAIAHFALLASREDPAAEAAAIESASTLPLLKIPDDPVSRMMGVEEWTVLNQSANGLRLHRQPGGNVGVTVGEAVGVRFASGHSWNVGVVRWLSVLENNDLEFGVELIAPTAYPVEIEPTLSTNARQQPALKLPVMQAEGESETLLAYPETYSDLREFEINEGGELKRVRATSLVEKTSRFEIFQINPS